MLLSTQIQAMLYAFIVGLAYGFFFSMKQYVFIYINSSIKNGILDIVFHLLYVLLVYYGLFQINGGMYNIYLILLFIFGAYLYYIAYYPLCLYWFKIILKIVKPIFLIMYLLMSKIYCIMMKSDKEWKKHGSKKKEKIRI